MASISKNEISAKADASLSPDGRRIRTNLSCDS